MATLTFYPSASNSGWTNSQYGYANDTSYATAVPAKSSSTTVQYSGFSIDSSIPANATINSVTLYVNWKVSTTGYAYDTLTAQIYVNGVAKTPSISTTSLTTTFATNSIVLTGLTIADLQDSYFKVYIKASRGSTTTSYTAYLSYTYVVVDYLGNAIETPTDLYNTINTNMKSDNLTVSAQRYISINSNLSTLNISPKIPRVDILTEIRPNCINSNLNINAPLVKWNKNINSPVMGATINANTNINVKVYRQPPVMKTYVFGNACKDMHLGSEDNPRLISTLADLQSLTGQGDATYNWYALTNDIDGGGTTIPTILNFFGNLDGRGYTIKNLTVQQNNNNYTGIFNSVGNQVFKNINLTNITLTKQNTSMTYYGCGFLTGCATGTKFININVSNCTITGNGNYCGGIVGYTNGSVYFYNCSVNDLTIDGGVIGGLLGYASSYTTVQLCKAYGNMIVSSTHNTNYVASFIGNSINTSTCFINNSYSRMNFAKNNGYPINYVGGFIGYDDSVNSNIIDSFYAGILVTGVTCGLIGNYSTRCMITNSYVDKDVSTVSASTIYYGIPLSTTQMKDISTYSNWGFPWVVDSNYNDGYPSYNFNITKPFTPKPYIINVSTDINNACVKSTSSNLPSTIYYDFGNNLPNGTTVTNYGAINDPLNSGRGLVFANTTKTDNTTCSAIIPLTFSKSETVSLEYFLSSESGYDKGKITLDGTVIFYASGDTTTNVITTAYGNGIVVGQWSTFNIPITSGSHTLKIEYSKDSSSYRGKDTFAIGRIYKDHYSFYSDKTSTSTEIYTNSMSCFTIGCGSVIEKKPSTLVSYLRPILPVAKTVSGVVINFATDGLPNGSTTSGYGIISDPTGSGKGNVLCNTNHADNSNSSAIIPFTLTSQSDVKVEFYISSESGWDWFNLLLDNTLYFKASGNGGSININTCGDTTNNPSINFTTNQWCTYVFKNVSAGSHNLTIRYTKDSGGSGGSDIGAVSKIDCGGSNIIYNAVYNGVTPKMIATSIINSILFRHDYIVNSILPIVNSSSFNSNNTIQTDCIFSAINSMTNARMLDNVDYFHIITTLIVMMGADNESIIINW